MGLPRPRITVPGLEFNADLPDTWGQVPSTVPTSVPMQVSELSLSAGLCETGGAGLSEPILQTRKLRPRRGMVYLKSHDLVSSRVGEGQVEVPGAVREDQRPARGPFWPPCRTGAYVDASPP